jgi:hypothetical protein
MFNDYSDIIERIAELPKWWDEQGVPRYAEFGPDLVANIYAWEVALVEIACSACGTHFAYAMSGQSGGGRDENGISMAEHIRRGDLENGDPPNYGNCPDGASMGCYNLRVLQYWTRPKGWGTWIRDSSLEIIQPGMADHLERHPDN